MQIDENLPVYPMGIAARLLKVHPRTLRIYEAEGLVVPVRQGGKRFFSQSDLIWIKCLRSLIHEENISIEGVKRLLEFAPCWRLKNCPVEVRENCPVLKKMDKKCWEFSKKTCENSCENCEFYLRENDDERRL